MDNCIGCEKLPFPHYRVVRTISERNTIPCDERINGMLVTVQNASRNKKYVLYMLQGIDACSNSNWVEYITLDLIEELFGNMVIEDEVTEEVTAEYLNTLYPNARSGFRVTFTTLNTSFIRLFDGSWVMNNNVNILYNV